MKKTVLLLSILIFLSACSTHTHIINDGPSTGLTETKRQYYVLWGLIPINKVDTNAMIGDATNFRIETGIKGTDVLIGITANMIIPTTVSSRTVTVTK